jgi:TIR domain/Pentapeptide repeats (8 copies)
MANPEHLQRLKQGVEAWNAWRDRHRDIKPNLRGADLTFEAIEADFGGADLTDANLTRSDLVGASLYRAILRKADLREAILRGADLRGAILHGAILTGADFGGATLIGADVSEVSLFETVFGNTNLTAVRGLETCVHEGPSTLDHRTLARSGPLPLAFLRGCGLPDSLIEYLPSLLGEPFQFYSCFISYASKDHAFAERLYADLQNKGIRCWFAPEDMKIGDRLRPRIDETIRVYDKLLLVLSKTSVTSQWVEQEVETALARERQQGTTILFPVRIDNTVMAIETGWPALIRNTRNIGDFRRWKTHGVYQQAFDRLLRDLKAAERPPEGSRPVG